MKRPEWPGDQPSGRVPLPSPATPTGPLHPAEKEAPRPGYPNGMVPGEGGRLKRGSLSRLQPHTALPTSLPPATARQPRHVTAGSKWRSLLLPCWHLDFPEQTAPPGDLSCLPPQGTTPLQGHLFTLRRWTLLRDAPSQGGQFLKQSRARGGTTSQHSAQGEGGWPLV